MSELLTTETESYRYFRDPVVVGNILKGCTEQIAWLQETAASYAPDVHWRRYIDAERSARIAALMIAARGQIIADQSMLRGLSSPPEPPAKPTEGFYVFRTEGSHDQAMWWRPNRRGYTFNIEHAGIYSAEDAAEIEAGSHGDDYGVPVSQIEQLEPMTMIDGSNVRAWRRATLTKAGDA